MVFCWGGDGAVILVFVHPAIRIPGSLRSFLLFAATHCDDLGFIGREAFQLSEDLAGPGDVPDDVEFDHQSDWGISNGYPAEVAE